MTSRDSLAGVDDENTILCAGAVNDGEVGWDNGVVAASNHPFGRLSNHHRPKID